MSQRRPTHMYYCLRNIIVSTAFYSVIQLMTTFCHLLQRKGFFLNCLQPSVAYYYVLTTVSRQSFLTVLYDWNEPRMVKYIIWSYLPLFTIIYPYLAILAIFATICVIIYPYYTPGLLFPSNGTTHHSPVNSVAIRTYFSASVTGTSRATTAIHGFIAWSYSMP